MKFHAPSFLLGVGVAAALVAGRDRLRPVAVEVGALGVHLGRLIRSIAERRREDLEDLWAEIADRVEGGARRPAGADGSGEEATRAAA